MCEIGWPGLLLKGYVPHKFKWSKTVVRTSKKKTLVSIYEVQNGSCYGQPSTVAQTHTKLALGQPMYVWVSQYHKLN